MFNRKLDLRVRIDQKRSKYEFDIQIRPGFDESIYLLLAPRKIPGVDGCVVMQLYPLGETEVHIEGILHKPGCTTDGNMDKKVGTRAMVLGSMHLMRSIAKERWPHLNSFMLQDFSLVVVLHCSTIFHHRS